MPVIMPEAVELSKLFKRSQELLDLAEAVVAAAAGKELPWDGTPEERSRMRGEILVLLYQRPPPGGAMALAEVWEARINELKGA